MFSLVRKSQRKDARMSCSRRWAADLPSHATTRSASQSHHRGQREHFDALRAGAVRGPHHRLPILARRHASAGVWLPALRGHVRQGQRIPEELLLEVLEVLDRILGGVDQWMVSLLFGIK